MFVCVCVCVCVCVRVCVHAYVCAILYTLGNQPCVVNMQSDHKQKAKYQSVGTFIVCFSYIKAIVKMFLKIQTAQNDVF